MSLGNENAGRAIACCNAMTPEDIGLSERSPSGGQIVCDSS